MFDHQHGRRDVTYNDDSKGNKDFKKAIGIFSKSSTLDVQHTFLVRYLCRPLHKYNMKFPNRTFYGRRKQVYLATFDIFERDLIATDFEKKKDFLIVTLSSALLKLPIMHSVLLKS